MSDVTLKQIKKVIQEELKPINTKLDKHDNQFRSITAKLDEHSQKLDSLTLDIIDVQKKTDVLKDIQSYIEDTKGKVDDHEERLQSLESTA